MPRRARIAIAGIPWHIIQHRGLFEARRDNATVEKIRRATNGNSVLGNQRFREKVVAMFKRRVTPGKPDRPRKIKPT